MIFFDIDGTLLDFKRAEFLGVRSVYAKYGERFIMNESRFYAAWCAIGKKHFAKYLRGQTTFEQQKMDRVKEVFGLEGVGDAEARAVFQAYLSGFEDNWAAYDDVLPCLRQLRGQRLGILSNGDGTQQKAKLQRMGIDQYFYIQIISGEIGFSRPGVEIFWAAAEQAGELPRDCVYVGDDLYTDILPCGQAGMKGIWLKRDASGSAGQNDVAMIRSLRELAAHL